MLEPNPNEGAAVRGDYTNISEADEVTATVTSAPRPARETPTLAEFMSAVVAWPGSPTDPGYVNLHYSMPNAAFDPTKKADAKNKKWFMSGWPYKDVTNFVNRVGWLLTVPSKF